MNKCILCACEKEFDNGLAMCEDCYFDTFKISKKIKHFYYVCNEGLSDMVR